MSKGLEAFRDIVMQLTVSKNNTERIDTIEKELKALELIKRINFDIVYREQLDEWTLFIIIQTQDGEYLESVAFGTGKEEYDLLKEVLL